MKGILHALLLSLLPLTLLHCLIESEATTKPTFIVDWEHDRFLKDGVPFRFIAGSFHYFRAHPATWQKSLRTMRAAGLNAVTTYVEWSLHNPRDGSYNWKGIADLEKFIRLAIAEDLLIILRPGPYICAERDMGGFPYWLLNKYPGIQLRTADINYLHEVRIWYSVLMPLIEPYLYGNGGSIIMVQVENEYGSYACDKKYKEWLRAETAAHVKGNAVLFTNDGPTLVCGHIPGVLATLDFGHGIKVPTAWKTLRKIQPRGPLVNVEYYPGWLTHWSEDMQRVNTSDITGPFIEMLNSNASVNFYMFYGGTNFGFTAGANDGGPGKYQADITSYDYDAPMDEAGDPTPKYFELRKIIKRYLPDLRDVPVPAAVPKKHYGAVQLQRCCSLLSPESRLKLATGPYYAQKPQTFEALNQYSGLVLYETLLPKQRNETWKLRVPGLHDRGYVYIDNALVGILTRETPIYELSINNSVGEILQIFVENQGRINYNIMNDFKGILSDVFLDKRKLENWNMTRFPLESYADIEDLIELVYKQHHHHHHKQHQQERDQEQQRHLADGTTINLSSGPTLYHGTLNINDVEDDIGDTYIDMSGWGKGLVYINGENLGRYWPSIGPQITLYVPAPVLKPGTNQVAIVEYEFVPANQTIVFIDKAKLDGY